MRHQFTLDYGRDGPWYAGRLREVPGVIGQGATLDELYENIQNAYDLMVVLVTPDRIVSPPQAHAEMLSDPTNTLAHHLGKCRRF